MKTLIALLLFSGSLFAQLPKAPSNQSLRFDFGTGKVPYNTIGAGLYFSAGYQYSGTNYPWRINPSIQFGVLPSDFLIDEIGTMSATSTSIKLMFYYQIFELGNISWDLGVGPAYNYFAADVENLSNDPEYRDPFSYSESEARLFIALNLRIPMGNKGSEFIIMPSIAADKRYVEEYYLGIGYSYLIGD